MKIAIVQKCPSRVDYEKQFMIEGAKVYNLCSEKKSKILKRDVDLIVQTKSQYEAILEEIDGGHATEEDLGFCPDNYDYVILVGSEALKMFTKATSVTDYTGKVAPSEGYDTTFIASISPAMLAFKPEAKPAFDQTVQSVHKILSGKGEIVQEGEYEYFNTTDAINTYLSTLVEATNFKVIAMDSETTAFAPRDGYILGISISHKVGQGVYMDADYIDKTSIELLQKLLDTRSVVFHNAKFDMHFFKYHLGLEFEGRDIHDTLIMHYLLDERQGTHGLKPLTMKYGVLGDYDRELDEFKTDYCKTYKVKKEDFSYDLIPWDILKVYAAKDTDATLFLFEKFYPVLIRNPELHRCYVDLMIPAMHFLTRMEDRGVPISSARLTESRTVLREQLRELQDKFDKLPEVVKFKTDNGEPLNVASPMQLRRFLFDYCKLAPTGKLTKTGAICTDAEVLKELSAHHPAPELIVEIKQRTKLINTYIDKLLPNIDGDGKVRTGFNLTATTSGRLSSSGKFNMQQLPRDNPIIKGCVVAPKGYRIVACDLVTAEIYYAAVLSKDTVMQSVFIKMKEDPKKYPDFHSTIAHMVFGLQCAPSEVKKLYPALRQAAKAISFGILYGSGPAKVAESVNNALIEEGQMPDCTTDKAIEYIRTYFNRFPQLKRWIDSCHMDIKKNGFIYNFFGRKRRLLNVNSADKGVASAEVRSGFNAIIQSVSSDHLLLGAIEADILLEDLNIDAGIFALVHDSVVALVKEDQVQEYLDVLYRCIQTDRGCSIPNTPIGVEQDSEEGGSLDYSCGKLLAKFPALAAVF